MNSPVLLSPSIRLLVVLCLLSLFPEFTMAQAPQTMYRGAVIRSGEFPGVRMSSGLTVYDEEFRNGRLLTRYWDSTGQVVPDAYSESDRAAVNMLPADTFKLEIESQELSGTWKWIRADKTETHDPDGLLVTEELESSARPIRVKVHTLLTGGPVMVRWLEVTNTGKRPTAISNVSPWAGQLWHTPGYAERLPSASDDVYEIGYLQYQKWGQEGAWKFAPVINQTRTVTGDRGKSGWGHPTFFAKNNATGEWFVASLGWSSNWKYHVTSKVEPSPINSGNEIDRSDADARLFFDMGPATVDPVLRVLDPGETVKTPETHILCMRSDLDHVIQTLHEHVRRDVLPANPPGDAFDVEANHRGYIFDHESEEGLKREIDMAADIGAELFMIDAGWYGQDPNNWWNNVGDWTPGSWLPNDLGPVREYARQKGMHFGLWVEPESVGSNSKLAKEHPEWISARDGKPVANGRQLDVANPAVAKWMESEIARVIRKYDLDMFRIDYNTTIEEGGNHFRSGFVENANWRHVENLYAMFDRLRKQFPKVTFQNCAGGGGRLDFGILARFDTTELSDWMRSPRGVKILNGMTWLLPPEILLRTFGTEVSDLQEDGDVESQLAMVQMALPIFRGIAPALGDLNPILRDKIRSGLELYKKELRPIMRGSLVYHHTPLPPYFTQAPWVVLEYATRDKQRSMATLFRTSNYGDSFFRFVPRGLNPSQDYHVIFKNRVEATDVSGWKLMQEGISVHLENAGTSEMLLFSPSSGAGQ